MMQAKLAVVGSFVQDLAFTVGNFPAPGQTIIGNFFTGPGGKGSNQAVAAHRQGVPTIFIGCVGDDLFGHGYQEWCKEEGLPIRLLTAAGSPTGAASIVINERAENAIVVALGANDALTPEHVRNALAQETSLSVVLLQAESNLQAAQAALTYARERGITSILNPAPINPHLTASLLSSANYITPNETELSFLLKHIAGVNCNEDISKLSDQSIRELCDHLPSTSVLMTLGEHGSILYQREALPPGLHGMVRGEVLRTPAIQVQPRDTTGAGDAFNGGLAAGLIRCNGNLPQAIRYATVVAGLSTEKMGTAPAMPTEVEVSRHQSFYLNS
jgi:ribokinase